MPFAHEQSGIYRRAEDGRCYVFLRWHTAERRRYQVVDFATVVEASCFLMGAVSASQVSAKTVRFETLTPAEYEEHLQRQKRK
jgi:hypothetical protein